MSPTRNAPLLRKLGRDGPQVPAVGLGLMGFSAGYGTAPYDLTPFHQSDNGKCHTNDPSSSDEERLKLLDRAWELGCTSWDTADAYGDSEELIGKWFKLHPERRKDIFLATKFGLKGGLNSSPENCHEAVEQSLKALGVDFIDLYYLHRAKPEIPIEKTMEAMKELVQ
jgi:aryl-alcohol dehydrogenase-like predicted oxidoreductase